MTAETVHILLVEDDDVDAKGVMRAFSKHRIANPLYRAKDGIEALEKLRGHQGRAAIPFPRLCLVDLNMPRMDGIDFLKALREDKTLHSTVAFVLTTSKSEEDKMAAYDLNVAGYLVKANVGVEFVHMVTMLDHYWRIVELPQEKK